ncbi:hypothetical protein GOP80_08005 [Planococcaceae bacterium Storch 2/2-2]|nr:hypothetical protein [Planococcaceae bacterium Storch 2/2-2]
MKIIAKCFNTSSMNRESFFDMRPIGLVSEENNEIVLLTKEELEEKLPNNGRVFVPPYLKAESGIHIVEVEESLTYQPEYPSHHRYAAQDVIEDELLEIHEVDLTKNSTRTELDEELKRIRHTRGMRGSFFYWNYLKTADGYLMGPIKCENRQFIIPEHAVSLDIFEPVISSVRYEDHEVKKVYHFTLDEPSVVVGSFSLETDEELVKRILKRLNQEKEVDGVSRQVRQKIADLVGEDRRNSEQRRLELERAHSILDTYLSRPEELIDAEALYEHPTFQKAKDKMLKDVKNDFLRQLEDTEQKSISKIKNLKSEIRYLEEQKEKAVKELRKVESSASQKVEQLKDDVLSTYWDQLLAHSFEGGFGKGLKQPTDEAKAVILEKVVQEQSVNLLESEEATREILSENIEFFTVGHLKIDQFLHRLFLISVKKHAPLVFYGKHSYDLGQMIGRSLAAEEFYSSFVDTETFRFEKMNEELLGYPKSDRLRAVHLHDLHVSPQAYNVYSFIRKWKWSNLKEQLDSIILTFETREEASLVFNESPLNYPLFDADALMLEEVDEEGMEELMYGQIIKRRFELEEKALESKEAGQSIDNSQFSSDVKRWLWYLEKNHHESFIAALGIEGE